MVQNNIKQNIKFIKYGIWLDLLQLNNLIKCLFNEQK